MIEINTLDLEVSDTNKAVVNKAASAILSNLEHNISINLCSDAYMIKQNQKSLNHNYYTDILTYYYDAENPLNEAEILISIDRVKENATTHSSTFAHELSRVVLHGCLHLMGFNDTTPAEQKEMRTQEDHYLTKLFHVEP